MAATTTLFLVACGDVDITESPKPKVPLTTASPEARRSYLEGWELFEHLRFTEANGHFVAAVEDGQRDFSGIP